MKKQLDIVIIGAGNVAQHLADSFREKDHIRLVQVFNHKLSKTSKSFAKENNVELVTEYSNINRQANVYFICVKDDALNDVVNQMAKLKLEGLVVHTSGSIDMKALSKASKNIGVYYPLQTFSSVSKIDWETTPILIEANSTVSLKILKQIASAVSSTVKMVDSIGRLKLHLAAVMVSNFTNALYAAAFKYIEINLSKNSTALLMPLMQETISKLNKLSPIQSQTGPAMRDDKIVMKKHLQLLKNNPELTAVYNLLSQLIRKQQNT